MAMDPLTALGAKIGGPAADESTRVQRGIDYIFALELVKAMRREEALSKPATRKPTSPQPTIKTRGRRNLAGKAPSGL
jgi:hypothetical protein